MDKNMDSTELDWTLHPKQHQRVIIHIDIDCFYAQVEMVRNPELRNKPMGVKQKYLMVTSNYTARALGVKKQMYVTEALKVLPELILIDGSDLTPYRQFSNEISSIAQTFTPHVERMGLDENFLDITEKVRELYDSCSGVIVGHFYGHEAVNQVPQSDPCGCGCYKRLIVGTQIASNLRKEIFEKTGITCCAGIAHNKVLAKMVSGYRKPNQQTVIFPWQVCELMSSLDHVKSVPGIGNVTTKNLEELNISSVQDLQRTDMKILRTRFDEDTCRKLKNLSYGIDDGLVRGSVRPQSLGIEDAFTVTKVTSYEIIKSKYEALLERLLKLLADDGRVPSSLKVVVRKSDGIVKFGPRESKQIALSGSFFSKGVINISENTKSSLYSLIISAFNKMVDINKPFCLTLVGLGFTKLIEQPSEKKSIAQFFKKRPHDHLEKSKLEAEEQNKVKIPRNNVYPSLEGKELQAANMGKDMEDDNCDSDGEFSALFNDASIDIASKSNLQGQGNLNDNPITLSLDNSRLGHYHGGECSTVSSSSVREQNVESSHSSSIDIDPDVFNSLPEDIQEEVRMNYKVNNMYFENKTTKSEVSKSIPHVKKINSHSSFGSYFKPGLKQLPLDSVPEKKNENSKENEKDVLSKSNPCGTPESETSPLSLNKLTKDLKVDNDRELLDSIDYAVFSALPEELQKEILDDKRRQKNLGMRRAVGSQSTTKRNIQSSPILKYFKKL
ncbi:DNA polymerase iota-like isoform X2 [Palaemon carinicauda]|uniref:DNA polymerase iota-like isoform X2 n=1 Tax=Palaemon carinicauda TaxID=392227 RepID=UPI0035B638E3